MTAATSIRKPIAARRGRTAAASPSISPMPTRPGAEPGSWSGMLWRLRAHADRDAGAVLRPHRLRPHPDRDRRARARARYRGRRGARRARAVPAGAVSRRGSHRQPARGRAGRRCSTCSRIAHRAIDVAIPSDAAARAARCVRSTSSTRSRTARVAVGAERFRARPPTQRCGSTAAELELAVRHGRVALASVSSRSAP